MIPHLLSGLRASALLAAVALAGSFGSAWAQTTILNETFDTDVSANFIEVLSYNTSIDTDGTGDYTSNYNFNYANITTDTGASNTMYSIPEAPNSGASPAVATTGAYFQVNNDAGSAAPTYLSIYPDIAPITGPHTVQVDFFMVLGEINSQTEFVGMGLNHVGDKINSVFQIDPDDFFSVQMEASDGYFFDFTVEGGSGIDLSFLEGDPDLGTTEGTGILADGSAGFLWNTGLDAVGNNNSTLEIDVGDLDGADSRSNYAGSDVETWFINSGLFGTLFSTQADGPNESWVTLRMRYSAAGVVTVSLNIYDGNNFVTICTYDDPDDTWTSGIPMISLFDTFASFNADNALIIDNLIITDDSAPAARDWSLYQ